MNVSLRFNSSETAELQTMLQKTGLNQSQLIKECLFNNSKCTYITKSKEFYQALMQINHELYILENRYSNIDFDPVRREIHKACLILNL